MSRYRTRSPRRKSRTAARVARVNTAVAWPLGMLSAATETRCPSGPNRAPPMVRPISGLNTSSVSSEDTGAASRASTAPRHQRARTQASAAAIVTRVTSTGSPSQVSTVSGSEVMPTRALTQLSTAASSGPAAVCPA